MSSSSYEAPSLGKRPIRRSSTTLDNRCNKSLARWWQVPVQSMKWGKNSRMIFSADSHFNFRDMPHWALRTLHVLHVLHVLHTLQNVWSCWWGWAFFQSWSTATCPCQYLWGWDPVIIKVVLARFHPMRSSSSPAKQLFSHDHGVSQLIEGHAAAFTELKLDGALTPYKLFTFFVCTSTRCQGMYSVSICWNKQEGTGPKWYWLQLTASRLWQSPRSLLHAPHSLKESERRSMSHPEPEKSDRCHLTYIPY